MHTHRKLHTNTHLHRKLHINSTHTENYTKTNYTQSACTHKENYTQTLIYTENTHKQHTHRILHTNIIQT